MKGRTFEYAKQKHTVQKYTIDEGGETFEVKTDLNTFKRKFESAAEFFKYWFESKENITMDKAVAKVGTDENPEIREMIVKENSLSDDLVSILKDNITKLKANPSYINQAKAINNNVNSILNIQKLKLEMVKQMRGK
jgi:hypothetical protein